MGLVQEGVASQVLVARSAVGTPVVGSQVVRVSVPQI